MSPTVFFEGPYRFFFFSKEETRMHVHIVCSSGQAKFWIEPLVSLADFQGKISKKELKEIQMIVENRREEIEKKWKKHFS